MSRNYSSMSLIAFEGNPVEHLPSFQRVLQSSPDWRQTALVALSFAPDTHKKSDINRSTLVHTCTFEKGPAFQAPEVKSEGV